MNLWHDISLGDNAPDEFNMIVEINKGSKNKYEINKETGLIALDRALHTAQDYPFDYGFAPQTFWDDDDALDVVLLTTYPLFPGIMVKARPIALMRMVDSGDDDDKVIAVPVKDPRWDNARDINDINNHTLKEMEHFFTTYKKMQDKEVVISGFENAAAAREAILRSITLYNDKFGGK